jgi:hypothetical protein
MGFVMMPTYITREVSKVESPDPPTQSPLITFWYFCCELHWACYGFPVQNSTVTHTQHVVSSCLVLILLELLKFTAGMEWKIKLKSPNSKYNSCVCPFMFEKESYKESYKVVKPSERCL